MIITETFNNMRRALKVVTLDPELHSLLRERDPKALAQMEEAVAEADRMSDALREAEEVFAALLRHRAEAKRIEDMIEKLTIE